MNRSLNVLVVDDEPGYAEVIAANLQREDDRFTARSAESAEEGFEQFTQQDFDGIISDYEMPGMNGLEFLEAVRDRNTAVPFILFTGKGSEEVASDAISTGVTDYLQKQGKTEDYTLLANRMSNAIEAANTKEKHESHLRAIETANEGIGLVNPSGQFEHVNQYFAELYGWHPDEMVGEHWRVTHPDDEIPLVRDEYVPYAKEQGRWHGELTGLRADGSTFTEEHTILAVEGGGMICRVQEASPKARESAELQRTRMRLNRLAETMENGLFVVSKNYSDVLFVNEAAEEIYGVTESKLGDEPAAWLNNVHPADRATLEESIERQREGAVEWPVTQEFRIQHPSHGLRWVLTAVQPITDSDGETIEIAGVVTDITKQKQREKRTREANIVLETIIESMPFGILVEDAERNVLAVNEQLGEILGVPLKPDELRGRDCAAAAAELKTLFADPDRFISVLDERMAERELVRNEVVELADGRVLERDYVPYALPDGEANLWLYRDITARKQQERELSNRIEAMDASIDGMAIVDDTDEFVYVNEAHAEVYGYDSGEAFIGETWKMCYDEATLGRFAEEIIPSLNSHGSWRGETTGRDKNGHAFPQELSLTLTDGGEIICVVRDISDRREYQDTLEQLHGATRELMAASTSKEIVTLASEMATRILGQPRNRIHLYDAKAGKLVPAAWTDEIEEILENDPSSLPLETGPAGRAYQTGESQRWTTSHAGDEACHAGTPFETEYVVPLGDHGVFVISSPEPVAFSSSDRALAEVFAANITAALDRVERQEQLQRERDRLDDFAGMLSHDIRNPLNVAMGRLEVVQAEYESEQFAAIERAHNRIETLIEDVLTLARQGKQVDEPVSVELATIVNNCWQNVETTEATLIDEADGHIRADPKRLTQLIENLLRNAIEHGGDDVTITIGYLDTRKGLYVADDGPGIAEPERETVFEAGYSTAHDGTGLGLNIVQQIVEAHGWHANITESEAGGVRVEISGVTDASPDIETS